MLDRVPVPTDNVYKFISLFSLVALLFCGWQVHRGPIFHQFNKKKFDMSEFYKYFKENMEGLGLPAPESLFGSVQAAVANATIILSQIEKFGKSVTVGELIGAGTRLEGLGAIAACSAAFYVGAIIGSIAVATGRSLAGGTTIADVILTANKYDLNRPWLISNLHRWPGVYNPKTARRNLYRFHTAMA